MAICKRPCLAASPAVRIPHRIQVLLVGLLLIAVFPRKASADGTPSPTSEKRHQKPYALIFGTVWGPDDHALYGVPVKVRRANEKKVRWHLISDHNGEFALRVPAGLADYVVWIDSKDFKPLPGKQLAPGKEAHVHIENDERFDLGLHLINK